MAELYIAHPHVIEGLEDALHLWKAREEFEGIGNRSIEDLADILSEMDLLKDGEKVELLDIDLAELDLESGVLGDLDGFWEEAAASDDTVLDDALSHEEAVELGLIPKDPSIE